jgi:hypothetical protein
MDMARVWWDSSLPGNRDTTMRWSLIGNRFRELAEGGSQFRAQRADLQERLTGAIRNLPERERLVLNLPTTGN